MNIGEYVKQYRKNHALSMDAFGKLCGLSRAYISILEKGINPTTNKSFVPTLETLNKIAIGTNNTLDNLLKLLDEAQPVMVNSISFDSLNANEQTLIKKYRQLDTDGKYEIDKMIEIKLDIQNQKSKDTQSIAI
jgi:prophage lambdaSa1, repressor protein, putative